MRRRRRRNISQNLRSVIKTALLRLLSWLSDLVDRYVIRTSAICADEAVQCKSPQSLRHQCKSGRTYTIVSDDAKWEILEKASLARANYAQALRLRADCDSSLGCNDQEGDRWASTKAFMYHERVTKAFTLCHLCRSRHTLLQGGDAWHCVFLGIRHGYVFDVATSGCCASWLALWRHRDRRNCDVSLSAAEGRTITSVIGNGGLLFSIMNVLQTTWSEMYREMLLDSPANGGLSGATVTGIV